MTQAHPGTHGDLLLRRVKIGDPIARFRRLETRIGVASSCARSPAGEVFVGPTPFLDCGADEGMAQRGELICVKHRHHIFDVLRVRTIDFHGTNPIGNWAFAGFEREETLQHAWHLSLSSSYGGILALRVRYMIDFEG
ncbi:hypothetical protein FA13DRAFT_1729453 [Coprinellus micaceus]|uniref:Uncharacterized protein n=1 Tax=Coprinellus micaceus TaxID=71717 RepID=A0A4Y7TKT2_COPMI|nr:hypothetical protein FA13DRAFT_1729453 [Coprinellus micaceus]